MYGISHMFHHHSNYMLRNQFLIDDVMKYIQANGHHSPNESCQLPGNCTTYCVMVLRFRFTILFPAKQTFLKVDKLARVYYLAEPRKFSFILPKR